MKSVNRSYLMFGGLVLACVPEHQLSSYSSGVLGESPGRGDEPVSTPSSTPEVDSPEGPSSMSPAVVPSNLSESIPLDAGFQGTSSGDSGASGGALPSDASLDKAAVVRPFPLDGARGVPANVELLMDFGRTMNTSTVTAAIQTDVPLAGASLAWTGADSVLRITLAQPLEVASGADPEAVEARCYTMSISDAAVDLKGLPITPSSVRFCTARRISQSLAPLIDRDSTGNFRSDGNYGDGTCARLANSICVGDSGFAANAEYRGFLSFDASTLPAVLEVVAAELQLDGVTSNGNPFGELGDLLIEQVDFGAIGTQSFVAEASLAVIGVAPAGASTLLFDLGPLRAPETRRLQFRMRFAAGTDLDNASDHLVARSDTPALRLDYLIP